MDSPALTEGARPQWYAHGYNRAELYRLAAAMGWLPRRVRLSLARRVGRLAQSFLPAERAVIRKTLEVMTGASGRRLDDLTAEVFGEFAMCFSDLITASRRPARIGSYLGVIRGREVLQTFDGALISLTAHVGNWELAGRVLAQHSARTTHVVVAVEEAQALERWLRRDGGGLRFVPRTHPTVSLTLIAALRRGEAVALQGDRALGNRGDVPIPFFGQPAPFPVGPFHLARAAGVPVVPAFCTLDVDGRYVLRVLPPMKIARGGEQEALAAWVATLESIVAEKPTQWFNFFDVWNPFGP
jgi:phosphatidylinositol dimannoside acyltransferase